MASIFKASRSGSKISPKDFFPQEPILGGPHTVYSGVLTPVTVETPETRKVVFEVRTEDDKITYRKTNAT